MTETTWYSQGAFCWAECATTDLQGAKDFYPKLFGWEVEETPLPGGATYVQFLRDGKKVAGAAELGPDQAGIPPHWNTYIAVDDVDQVTKQAEQLGGTIVAEPFDVPDSGRMSVVQDPTGAAIGFWQAREHFGAEVYVEPNTMAWFELISPDPERAVDFYRELFGYGVDPYEYPNIGKYWVLTHKGENACGIYKTPEGGPPPAWTPYVGIEDLDGTWKAAMDAGASEMLPPAETADVGKIAWFQDPQGAPLALIQPLPRQ
jgi:predicted enzyme related to lactoylglutathione lyase